MANDRFRKHLHLQETKQQRPNAVRQAPYSPRPCTQNHGKNVRVYTLIPIRQCDTPADRMRQPQQVRATRFAPAFARTRSLQIQDRTKRGDLNASGQASVTPLVPSRLSHVATWPRESVTSQAQALPPETAIGNADPRSGTTRTIHAHQIVMNEGFHLARRREKRTAPRGRDGPTWKSNSFGRKWCRREESNLHGVTHTDLNRARLPVPPRRHRSGCRDYSARQGRYLGGQAPPVQAVFQRNGAITSRTGIASGCSSPPESPTARSPPPTSSTAPPPPRLPSSPTPCSSKRCCISPQTPHP